MTDNQQTPAYLQRGELRVGDLATLFSEMGLSQSRGDESSDEDQ